MKNIFRSPESKEAVSRVGKRLHLIFGTGRRGVRLPPVILLLYLGVLGFFGLFFVLPIAVAVRGAFLDQTGALTFDYVREVLRNPIYLEGFANALRLAVGSTFFAFAIAAPLAWISERFEFPQKRALSAFLLLPMMLPPFVGAIGVRQIFGQDGAVNALLHTVGWLGQNQVIDWLGAGREWGIIA
jgi:iron(III) transport system permease protein